MVVTAYGDTSMNIPDANLPEPYRTDFAECYQVWHANRSKNAVRRAYYEGENRLKNIGIAIPEELEDLRIVVNWPKVAIEELANLSRFDGFTSGDGDMAELNSIMAENAFRRKYRQLARSELVQGLSFATVTRGDPGEPSARIRCYSAVNAACTWDYSLERIRCGLTVHDVDKRGNPTRYELYEPDCIVTVERIDRDGGLSFPSGARRWTHSIRPHPMGRPPMEPIVHDPDIDYPLGHSRITKAVMDVTDRAVREALRTEIASEFAATPQKFLLGGTKKDKELAAQGGTRWEMYIGAIQWFTKDKDGDVPQYGQLPQVSMSPHSEYFGRLAEEFAAITHLPVDLLVRSRTYTSSDSAQANRDSLVQVAETMNDDNGDALRVIGKMALAVSRNVPLDRVQESIVPVFRSPQRASAGAQADWMTKMCATFPWLADTEVALEKAGFTEDERVRLMSEKRRAQASDRIRAMQEAMRAGDAV